MLEDDLLDLTCKQLPVLLVYGVHLLALNVLSTLAEKRLDLHGRLGLLVGGERIFPVSVVVVVFIGNGGQGIDDLQGGQDTSVRARDSGVDNNNLAIAAGYNVLKVGSVALDS